MLMPISPIRFRSTPRSRRSRSSISGVMTDSQLTRIGKCTELSVCPGPSIVSVAMPREILEPEELPEVIAPGGPLIASGRRYGSSVLFRVTTERFVHLADGPPVGAPVLPFRRLRYGRVEVIEIDTVGDEARPPVMRGDLDAVARFHTHDTVSFVRIARSRLDPRSCSRIAA